MYSERKFLLDRYGHRYKLYCPNDDFRYFCHYCGMPAPSLDHVPPLNALPSLLMEYEKLNYIKVPCCNECNSIAGDYPHTDFIERQKYIKEKLKKKYQKYIKSPDWEDYEISELGYRMKQLIEATMSIKYLVAYRLTYGEELNFNIKDLGYMQFDPRKIEQYADVNSWENFLEKSKEKVTF